MNIRLHIKYLPYFLFFLLLVISTINFPFFWDTVQLASKHAHFFYNSGFNNIILPNEIDSGHIPALGIYLALIWTITGKFLIMSHMAMLPFVFGIVFQLIILVRRIFSPDWQSYALIILMADATLMAQCTLVSSDVLVVFFFLMSLNNILRKSRLWLAVALAGLTLSSMRGMMCVAGLFTGEVLLFLSGQDFIFKSGYPERTFKFIIGTLKAYLPSMLIAIVFFSWHFYKTGWIGYHGNMPWATLFQTVGIKGAIWNAYILGWRLVDFGRIFVWIAGIICLLHFIKNRPDTGTSAKAILIFFICIFFALAQAEILHRNLSAHRYFLPVYILFSLLVTYYLFEVFKSEKWKKVIFYIMLAGMLSGNFWIYPDSIAKGWDSSLAYLPYFHLREQMMNYMEKTGIKVSETGTLFPNLGPIEDIDLSGNMNSFADLDSKTNHYVFYSNVYNDFPAEVLSDLKKNWKEEKEFRYMGVKIILYRSPYVNHGGTRGNTE
jgi:hypothetical protein